MTALTWSDIFKLASESYSASDIKDIFQYNKSNICEIV